MICAISPAQRCKSETFSTLRFAQRAKAIKNKATINEEMQDDVNVLREVIRQLKVQRLSAFRHLLVIVKYIFRIATNYILQQ